MKILHVVFSLSMGGAEKLVTDLIPRLRNLGNRVDILTFDGTETAFMTTLKKQGIRVIRLNEGKCLKYDIKNIFRLIPIIHKYDIVHTHTTPPQYFTALAKALSLSRVKLVTTEHSTNNHRRGKILFTITDRIIYGLYERIICVAEQSKINLEKQISKQNRICVIENGINVNLFHESKSLNRQLLGFSETDFLLVMVGRFIDAKDQASIIRAIKLLPKDIKLLLVGEGPLRHDCEDLVRMEGIADRVKFVGFRCDIPEVLHASDVAIMSSHWEGLSLSSVEGMSVDIPFVASDVQGLRDVVADAGLLFEENNEHELAEIISRLHDDTELYKNVAKKCYERAKMFDINNTVAKYNKVYKDLFNS